MRQHSQAAAAPARRPVRPGGQGGSELLPRYRADDIGDSTRCATRFPDFEVTTYGEGITALLTP